MPISSTSIEEDEKIERLRDAFNNIEQHIALLPDGRHKSLALTHLEIASMFAVKAATAHLRKEHV